MNKIYQSVTSSIEIVSPKCSPRCSVHLTDDEIARIIQVRFQFKEFSYDDLVLALAVWKAPGIKQVSIEEVMGVK